MENVNVRMPTHVKEEMAKQANTQDRSLSNYLLRIVMHEFNKIKGIKPNDHKD